MCNQTAGVLFVRSRRELACLFVFSDGESSAGFLAFAGAWGFRALSAAAALALFLPNIGASRLCIAAWIIARLKEYPNRHLDVVLLFHQRDNAVVEFQPVLTAGGVRSGAGLASFVAADAA
jgi:hypothetical protein